MENENRHEFLILQPVTPGGIKPGNHRLNLTAEKYAVFVICRISIMAKVNFNEGG
jgi:hypothetical protein